MTVTPLQRFATWQLSTLTRSCLVMVAAVVSLGICLFITIVLAYVIPLPRSWDDLRFIIGFILGMVSYMVLWCSASIVVVIVRKRKLDVAIQQFNVQFKSSMLGQRNQAQLNVAGTEINVLIQKGPMLTLTVPVSSGVRATLNELTINQVNDQPWIQHWLEQAGVKDHIQQLFTPSSTSEVRSIIFTPQTMMFRIYRFPLSTLTSDTVQALLNNYAAIAQAAKRLPASTTPTEVSALEKWNDIAIYQPQKIYLWVFVILGALLFGGVLLVGGMLLLAVAVSS